MNKIIIIGLSALVLLLACTAQIKETESPQILNQKPILLIKIRIIAPGWGI